MEIEEVSQQTPAASNHLIFFPLGAYWKSFWYLLLFSIYLNSKYWFSMRQLVWNWGCGILCKYLQLITLLSKLATSKEKWHKKK
jgi:hypothetical protein